MSNSIQIAIPQLSIPKLQGEADYTPWTPKVKLALLQEDLWRIATGAETQPGPWYDKGDVERSSMATEQQKLDKWTIKATRASTIILLALEDGPYEHVSEIPVENPVRILELVTTTLEDCEGSVVTCVDTLKRHYKRLTDLNGKLPGWVLIGLILFGLCETYENFVSITLAAMRTIEPQLNDIISGLIDEEH
ncbi:MAG: hypothetical protein M1840_001977 [Geoglossum simile]|nr:MAG: hypothetical protein M1840_001977 [Geoglossum simile]